MTSKKMIRRRGEACLRPNKTGGDTVRHGLRLSPSTVSHSGRSNRSAECPHRLFEPEPSFDTELQDEVQSRRPQAKPKETAPLRKSRKPLIAIIKMKDRQRTFVLGAGFSKAVADGPLMNEIWNYIEKAYENEKKRKVPITGRNKRLEWFSCLDDFINKLEEEATYSFSEKDFDKIQVGIRKNIEYLFTLIDLHLSGPKIEFEKEGVDCLFLSRNTV